MGEFVRMSWTSIYVFVYVSYRQADTCRISPDGKGRDGRKTTMHCGIWCQIKWTLAILILQQIMNVKL